MCLTSTDIIGGKTGLPNAENKRKKGEGEIFEKKYYEKHQKWNSHAINLAARLLFFVQIAILQSFTQFRYADWF